MAKIVEIAPDVQRTRAWRLMIIMLDPADDDGALDTGKPVRPVIPAEAGIQVRGLNWTPASAGVTGMRTRKRQQRLPEQY